jgi:hypothetical protein
MASTKIILNGRPGQRIYHSSGLRQVDHLSPLLFMLTMEALNAMPSLADDMGLFTDLRSPAIHHRASLYANDLVFLVPTEQDIQLVHGVMEIFVGVLGLHTNISKCQFTPIRCPEDHMAIVQQRLLQC